MMRPRLHAHAAPALLILVLLCMALLGGVVCSELHHHEDGSHAPKTCWACASGPVLAVATGMLLLCLPPLALPPFSLERRRQGHARRLTAQDRAPPRFV